MEIIINKNRLLANTIYCNIVTQLKINGITVVINIIFLCLINDTAILYSKPK